MKIRSILATLAVLAYIGFELSTLHSLRYRTEPLFIHNEFVTANHATRQCGDPDVDQDRRFQENFNAVKRKAQADLRDNNPELSETELTQRLESLARERIDEVDAFILENGCEDMQVWRWVKLHEVRARLNLR